MRLNTYGLRPWGFKGFIFGLVGSYFSDVLAGVDSDEDHQEPICNKAQHRPALGETNSLTPENMMKRGKQSATDSGGSGNGYLCRVWHVTRSSIESLARMHCRGGQSISVARRFQLVHVHGPGRLPLRGHVPTNQDPACAGFHIFYCFHHYCTVLYQLWHLQRVRRLSLPPRIWRGKLFSAGMRGYHIRWFRSHSHTFFRRLGWFPQLDLLGLFMHRWMDRRRL